MTPFQHRLRGALTVYLADRLAPNQRLPDMGRIVLGLDASDLRHRRGTIADRVSRAVSHRLGSDADLDDLLDLLRELDVAEQDQGEDEEENPNIEENERSAEPEQPGVDRVRRRARDRRRAKDAPPDFEGMPTNFRGERPGYNSLTSAAHRDIAERREDAPDETEPSYGFEDWESDAMDKVRRLRARDETMGNVATRRELETGEDNRRTGNRRRYSMAGDAAAREAGISSRAGMYAAMSRIKTDQGDAIPIGSARTSDLRDPSTFDAHLRQQARDRRFAAIDAHCRQTTGYALDAVGSAAPPSGPSRRFPGGPKAA